MFFLKLLFRLFPYIFFPFIYSLAASSSCFSSLFSPSNLSSLKYLFFLFLLVSSLIFLVLVLVAVLVVVLLLFHAVSTTFSTTSTFNYEE